MTLVHTAFLGFKSEMWTRCPDAPAQAVKGGAHLWEMGDADEAARCGWCHAVAWSTYAVRGKAPGGSVDVPCEHGRAPNGPPCPRCRCPHLASIDGFHSWQSDAPAEVGRLHQWCYNCHSVRGLP